MGRMGTGLYTLTLVGATALMLGIVGIEFLLHRQYLQAAFQAERQQELIEEPYARSQRPATATAAQTSAAHTWWGGGGGGMG